MPLATALREEKELRRKLVCVPAHDANPALVRAWWRAVEQALSAHERRIRAGVDEDVGLLAILKQLRGVAGNLAAGFVPEIVKRGAKHKHGRLPSERWAIGCALAYLTACEEGHIGDKHPTTTVAGKFGVDRTTVQKWCRSPSSFDFVPGGETRLDQAAAHYRRFGRSPKTKARN